MAITHLLTTLSHKSNYSPINHSLVSTHSVVCSISLGMIILLGLDPYLIDSLSSTRTLFVTYAADTSAI